MSSTPDDFLAVYLMLNMDFSSLIKLAQKQFIKKPEKKECAQALSLLEKVINDATNSLEKALKKGAETEEIFCKNGQEVIKLYKSILTDYNNDVKEYLDRFLRPIQDSYKLHSYFNDFDNIQDITILPNPHAVHADVNVVACFQNDAKLVDKPYIGVSKLCCGYCHKYLDDYEFLHRGTHGVCDDQWGAPWFTKEGKSPLEDTFKESVKPEKIFDIKDAPPQHRKLSFDNFEKDIKLSGDKR